MKYSAESFERLLIAVAELEDPEGKMILTKPQDIIKPEVLEENAPTGN